MNDTEARKVVNFLIEQASENRTSLAEKLIANRDFLIERLTVYRAFGKRGTDLKVVADNVLSFPATTP